MSQINLIDAIKVVMDNFEHFTDNQLHKFHKSASEEIEERKRLNNYNPKVNVRADNAGNKPKKEKEDDKSE